MRPETAPASEPIGPFRLGEWEVHPQRNELVSEQETRHLEPKAMDLLVFLTSSAPEVVSKNNIIDSVWEGRIISEGTLTNTVAELRRALGDDARDPRYIETIPKRGYRVVAPVEPVSSVELRRRPRLRRVDHGLSPSSPSQPSCWRRLCLTIVLVSRSRPLDPEFVVVGTFVNRTGDESLDATAVLARDRLVTALSGSGLVRAAPVGLLEHGDSLDPLCSAARDAGAGLAVGGALYLHEGEVEVQTTLVDVGECAMLVRGPSLHRRSEHGVGSAGPGGPEELSELSRPTEPLTPTSSWCPMLPDSRRIRSSSPARSCSPATGPRRSDHLERAVELDPRFTSASLRLVGGLRQRRETGGLRCGVGAG